MSQVLREAQHRFGIKRFRTGQREILEAVFARRNVLGLMPTGAGKSLTYQLPAVFLPRPVVVVSPLIARTASSKSASGIAIATNSTATTKKFSPVRV